MTHVQGFTFLTSIHRHSSAFPEEWPFDISGQKTGLLPPARRHLRVNWAGIHTPGEIRRVDLCEEIGQLFGRVVFLNRLERLADAGGSEKLGGIIRKMEELRIV